jgi:chromatin assembly factor 1 subunit A
VETQLGPDVTAAIDTPFPLDPFTFVSDPAVLEKANSSTIKKDVDGVFVVPALPERLFSASPAAAESSTGDTRGAKRKATNAAPPPKTTFPDTHVPLLLQRIAASDTNSFVVLLDSVFQDIKSLGIKKNALEVKLREVAEKDKTKKAWVVKDDVWVSRRVPERRLKTG